MEQVPEAEPDGKGETEHLASAQAVQLLASTGPSRGVRVRIRPTGAERRGWRERIEVRKATLASIVRKGASGSIARGLKYCASN